jgi:hypothetical protein
MAITEKEAKNYKKYLKELVLQAGVHLEEIDRIMKLSSDNERGKLIAKSCNELEFTKDRAKHFGLGLSLKK